MAELADHLNVEESGRRARTRAFAARRGTIGRSGFRCAGQPALRGRSLDRVRAALAGGTGGATTHSVRMRWAIGVATTTAKLPTPDSPDRLRTRLETPPDGGVGNPTKIAAWIAQDLGLVSVRPQRAWGALQAIGWSIQAPRPNKPGHRPPRSAGRLQKELAEDVARHPGRPVAPVRMDEHRTGCETSPSTSLRRYRPSPHGCGAVQTAIRSSPAIGSRST